MIQSDNIEEMINDNTREVNGVNDFLILNKKTFAFLFFIFQCMFIG